MKLQAENKQLREELARAQRSYNNSGANNSRARQEGSQDRGFRLNLDNSAVSKRARYVKRGA